MPVSKQTLDPRAWLDIADLLCGGKGSFIKWALENCATPVPKANEEMEATPV